MSLRSGVALLLLVAGCDRQSPAPEQAKAPAPAPTAALAAGAVDRSHKGAAAPDVDVVGTNGEPTSLREMKGPLLVNLWATWCAPCVAEMPTLDRAAAALGGKVTVLAINQGEDRTKVQGFLDTRPLRHARPALDLGMGVSLGLGANLPTTILYDAAGHELWRVTGGREWDSPESLKLIREAS